MVPFIQDIFMHRGSISVWAKMIYTIDHTLDNTFIDNKHTTSIIEEISDFLTPEKKERYNICHMPYTLNYLFYGPLGTEKLAPIYAITKKLKLNICFVNCLILENDEKMNTLLSKVPSNTAIIVENIDEVITKVFQPKSKFDNKKSGITINGFMALLNSMNVDGRVIFMVANEHPNHLILDAFVDQKIIFENASIMMLSKMFCWFFKNDKYTEDFLTSYIDIDKLGNIKPTTILTIFSENLTTVSSKIDPMKSIKSLQKLMTNEDSD